MKKISFLATFLFLLVNVNAQDVHLGVKGGANISQLHFNDDVSSDSKAGLYLGVLAHIHTSSKTWAIQPEIFYSMEGAKNVDNSGTTYNLNYLNVPVLLQYMFENGF